MGRIAFKRFYTELVEHYLRMGVRYERVQGDTTKEWFRFTKSWLDSQTEEDKDFLTFIFGRDYHNPVEGMYCYRRTEEERAQRAEQWRTKPVYCKTLMSEYKHKLYELERRFAIDSELISEELNEDE